MEASGDRAFVRAVVDLLLANWGKSKLDTLNTLPRTLWEGITAYF